VQIKEHYDPKPIEVNGTKKVGPCIAGFLCKATGTITVTDELGNVLVDAVPVTAGQYTKIPLWFPSAAGGSVTLASNAAGTLF
jgi:hypothetical protein